MLFLQILPITESGRSTPVSISSVSTLADPVGVGGGGGLTPNEIPMPAASIVVTNAAGVTSSAQPVLETPLIEVSEEDDDSTSTSTSTLNSNNSNSNSNSNREGRAPSVPKELKESKNYEMKQRQSLSSRRHSRPSDLNLSGAQNSPSNRRRSGMNYAAAAGLAGGRSRKSSNAGTGSGSGTGSDSSKDSTPTTSAATKQVTTSTKETKDKTETVSVGVQVNLLNKSYSSPSLARKLAHLAAEPEEMNLDVYLLKNIKSNYESKTLPRRRSEVLVKDKGDRGQAQPQHKPLRRGYTHDHMLGSKDAGKPAWKEELNKLRNKTPLRVSELIGSFDRRGSDCGSDGGINFKAKPDADAAATEAELKQRRRGSLQIHLDPSAIGQLAKAAEDMEAKRKRDAMEKAQRRKSTSSLVLSPSSPLESLKIQDILLNRKSDNDSDIDKPEPEVPEKEKCDEEKEEPKKVSAEQMTKKWDYFEMIDHPKAISDKKLQQLKAKYQRRRTEGSLGEAASKAHVSAIKEENEDMLSPDTEVKPMIADRSKSVPNAMGAGLKLMKPIDLSIDPMTGECLDKDNNGSLAEVTDVEKARKISTDSGEESAGSSRRSSRSSVHRRRSTHLNDILELRAQRMASAASCDLDSALSSDQVSSCGESPDTVIELRIDPLTGKVETQELKKKAADDTTKRRRLSVEIGSKTSLNSMMLDPRGGGGGDPDDHGFSSLPHTPTDLGLILDPRLKVAATTTSSGVSSTTGSTTSASTSQLADDGIFTSSEETLSLAMKKAASLDLDHASCDSTASSSSRPASATSNNSNNIPAVPSSSSSQTSTNASTSTTSATRRLSSPMIRPSCS